MARDQKGKHYLLGIYTIPMFHFITPQSEKKLGGKRYSKKATLEWEWTRLKEGIIQTAGSRWLSPTSGEEKALHEQKEYVIITN